MVHNFKPEGGWIFFFFATKSERESAAFAPIYMTLFNTGIGQTQNGQGKSISPGMSMISLVAQLLESASHALPQFALNQDIFSKYSEEAPAQIGSHNVPVQVKPSSDRPDACISSSRSQHLICS